MKRTLSIFIAIFLIVMLFTQCDNATDYEVPPADGRVVGSVHGIVQDSYSGERLADIVVEYVCDGDVESTTTDTMGYYSVTDLYSGNYVFTFMGVGTYATTKATITIPNVPDIASDNPSGEDYQYSIVSNASLYQMNAGIKGQVYAQTQDGSLVPASNVTVVAQVSSGSIPYIYSLGKQTTSGVENSAVIISADVEPSVFEAQTNSDGEYLFDQNLPCVSSYSIHTLPFTQNGVDYSAGYANQSVSVSPEVTVTAEDIVAQPALPEAKILSGPYGDDEFPVASNIIIGFSKPMDPESFEIQFSENWGDLLYCTATWSSDSLILTIDPYDELEQETTYSLSLEGMGGDGSEFDHSGIFSTEGTDEAMIVDSPIDEDEVEVDGDLVVIFSKSMDPSEFEVGLYRGMGNWGDALYFEAIWSENNQKLTIDPYLILQKNQTYYLEMEGFSQDGAEFYGDGTFFTEGEEEQEEFVLIRTNLQVVDGEVYDEFPVDENIELEFNLPINSDDPYDVLTLEESAWPNTPVEIPPSISDNRMKITLYPDGDLNADTAYRLKIRVYSESGQVIDMSDNWNAIEFSTAEE